MERENRRGKKKRQKRETIRGWNNEMVEESLEEFERSSNVHKSKTASGAKLRAMAMEAVCPKNRKAVGLFHVRSRMEKARKNAKEDKLREFEVERDVKMEKQWKERKTFYFGSREHWPREPLAEEDEAVVVEESELKILEDSDGLRLGREEVKLLPRSERMKGGLMNSLFEVLEKLDGKAMGGEMRQSGKRRATLDGEGSKHLSIGSNAQLHGKGSSHNMHGTEEDKEDHAVFSRFVSGTENAVRRHMSTEMIRAMRTVKRDSHHSNVTLANGRESEMWPAMVSGRNVFLNVHTDDDCATGLVMVTGKNRGDEILNYFCFPSLGVATALRSGDMLLFNPKIPHCVSSRVDGSKDVHCTSFCLKAALASGKDNQQKLTCGQWLMAAECEKVRKEAVRRRKEREEATEKVKKGGNKKEEKEGAGREGPQKRTRERKKKGKGKKRNAKGKKKTKAKRERNKGKDVRKEREVRQKKRKGKGNRRTGKAIEVGKNNPTQLNAQL